MHSQHTISLFLHCVMVYGISSLHIHILCRVSDMTTKVRSCLISYEQQLFIHNSIIHILHDPVIKMNSGCLIQMLRTCTTIILYSENLISCVAVNIDSSEILLSRIKRLINLQGLNFNHAWMPQTSSSVSTFLFDCLLCHKLNLWSTIFYKLQYIQFYEDSL